MYIMKNSIKRAQKELVHSAERENFRPWGKRIFAMAAVAMMTVVSAQAQELETDDLGIFNHASLSVGVGTTGITADLALPITPYVAVRGGADIFPLKYSTDLNIEYRNAVAQAALPETVAVTGKLAMTSGHLLFDFFPSNQSSFHITAGAYLGSDKVAEVYNKEDGALAAVTAYNRVVPNSQKAGYTLGDYFLTPESALDVLSPRRAASPATSTSVCSSGASRTLYVRDRSWRKNISMATTAALSGLSRNCPSGPY